MTSHTSDTPLFSVLLPTFNQVELLKLALASLQAQSLTSFEALVVSDGCTDGTQDVVRLIDDPRIRLFDLPKGRGFGYKNRNIGLREARGELIAILSHDNLYLCDHLEKFAKAFESPQVQFAHSCCTFVEADGRAWPWPFNLTAPDAFTAYMSGEPCDFPATTVVHRRLCLETYGYWNERRKKAGDWELWRRFLKGVGREAVGYVPVPTALHFRAPWRTKLRNQRTRIRTRYPHIPDPWPIGLDIPEGIPEQAVYWEAMKDAPGDWAKSFRAACRSVMDENLFRQQRLWIEGARDLRKEKRQRKLERHERRMRKKKRASKKRTTNEIPGTE